jgi:hypothetical protein
MKLILRTTIALFYLSICSSFLWPKNNEKEESRANFSGKWKLNIQKSNLGKVPIAAIYELLEIHQNKQEISIMQSNALDTKQVIPLNGESVEIKSLKNKRTKTINISWTDIQQVMILHITFTYDTLQLHTHPLKGIEEYRLSEDGRTMSIKRLAEISDPDLNWQVTAIYDKL